jgi:hypothetical protein
MKMRQAWFAIKVLLLAALAVSLWGYAHAEDCPKGYGHIGNQCTLPPLGQPWPELKLTPKQTECSLRDSHAGWAADGAAMLEACKESQTSLGCRRFWHDWEDQFADEMAECMRE